MEWNFPKQAGQIRGYADAGIEFFTGNAIASLAREICQNSLDALENGKIIYDNLKNVISPAMAADERLWAGLCHDYFYSYLRQRWDMIGKIRPKEKAIGEIETRFFIKKSLKAGLFRNTLAKCYWVGKGTYDSVEGYKLLDYIGASSISTKINDIFHNYNFTANRKILKGIIEGMNYFAVNNINFPSGTFFTSSSFIIIYFQLSKIMCFCFYQAASSDIFTIN